MKKIIVVLVVFMMLFSLFNVYTINASAEDISGSCGDNLTWNFNSDSGELVISGSGKMKYARVPWENYKGDIKTVTIEDGVENIGFEAFNFATELTNLTIPNSVVLIDKYAFGHCDSLKSVTIPPSVRTIKYGAFGSDYKITDVYISDLALWCTLDFEGLGSSPIFDGANLYLNGELLTDVVIPDTVETLNPHAFSGCGSLKTLSVGNGITVIKNSSFANCKNLTDVTISDSVTVIEGMAFNECKALTNVTLSKNLESIEHSLFSGCSKLESIIIPESVTSIGRYSFYETGLKSVNIPEKVSSIENYAFAFCKGLKEVKLGKELSSIGEDAFARCDNLTNIDIPDSVKKIGLSAFLGCDKLFQWENGVCYVDKWAIGAEMNYNFSTFELREDTVGIADNAFYHSLSIRDNITFPDSLKYVGKKAFEDCSYLKTVSIPGSVKFIDSYAFYRDTKTELKVFYLGSSDEWKNVELGEKVCNSFVRIHPEHNFSSEKVVVGATYDEEGIKVYTCQCGETKTESIPKITVATTATAAPATTIPEAINDDGCSSSLTLGAGIAILAVGAAALTVCKKKEN